MAWHRKMPGQLIIPSHFWPKEGLKYRTQLIFHPLIIIIGELLITKAQVGGFFAPIGMAAVIHHKLMRQRV